MSKETKIIRWGILGLGKIAHKFAEDLLTIEDCKLYAVASRSEKKAKEFASKYGAIEAYDSYSALAKDSTIDAVYIATPHSYHKEHTILCLNHGKAVLCEKPFAMNSQEVSKMIETAKANKVLLMEALWTYFLPHYRYVLNELTNKAFGNILKIEADFGFNPNYDESSRVFKKSLGGGSLLDIGIYPIFAALSTLGEPKSINAKATFFKNGVDSSCTMIFNYASNVQAYLTSTFLKETPTEAIFYCEKGTIKLNSKFHEPTTVSIINEKGEENTLDFNYNTIGYNFEAIHFNELLRAGKTESDIMSFEFSKKLISTLETVSTSIGLKY